MKTIADLEAADCDVAFPPEQLLRAGGESLVDTIGRVIKRINKIASIDFLPEGPSEFQDGPVYMCIQEYGPRRVVLGGFYFSKFGRFFTGGPISAESAIPKETWDGMAKVISNDYDFIYVPQEFLAEEYTGSFRAYRCHTWGDRLFAAWYKP